MFLGESCKSVLRDWKIFSEFAASGSHHQLGRIERQWRTYKEMSFAILTAAELPSKYRSLAMDTATYLRNRLYSNGSQGIPYLLAFNKEPCINHLMVFGCRAYVHIHSRKNGNFAPKSWPVVFVGYPSDSTGYKILNPRSGQLSISRSVTFNEQPVIPNAHTSPRFFWFK